MHFRFLLFFFHFFIQAKTLSSTLDSEVKEVSYNQYYKEEITGRTVNDYKLVSQCETCSWFKIEIADNIKNNSEMNLYTDFSYKIDLSQESNSTDKILQQFSSESNGVRRIILQIDLSAEVNSLIYSVQLRDTNGKEIPEDAKLKYIIKFCNSATKDELLPVSFNDTLSQFFGINFKEIFNATNIELCIYYVVSVNPYHYSSAGIHTIFWEEKYVIETYIGYNNKRTISFKYESPYIKGYLVSVYVKFRYKGSNEEHLVSYNPFYYTYYTKQQYMYLKKRSGEQYSRGSYLLEKKNSTEKYYVIEFNGQPKSEGSYDGRQLPINFCAGELMTYENTTDKITVVKEEFQYGKTTIILEVPDEDLIFFFLGKKEDELTVEFEMRYFTTSSLSDVPSYDNDFSVKVTRQDDLVKVTFTTLPIVPNVFNHRFYYLQLYNQSSFTDEYDLDNIFTSPKLLYTSIDLTFTNDANTYPITITREINYDAGELYANIYCYSEHHVQYYSDLEEKLSYKHTKVIIQEYEQLPQNDLRNLTLNDVDRKFIFKLVPSSKEEKYYVIQISTIEDNLDKSFYRNNTFDYVLQISSKKELKNDTDVKMVKEDNQYGMRTIIIDGKDIDQLIFKGFLINSNSSSTETLRENGYFGFFFNYKTISKIEDDTPLYVNKDFTVTVSSKGYHLQFEELFNEQSGVENCSYFVLFYKKQEWLDTKTIENVNPNCGKKQYCYQVEIKAKNNGKVNKQTIPLNTKDSEFNKDIYAKFVVYYKLKSGEEHYDFLGINDVPYDEGINLIWIIISVVVGVLIIGGIVLYIKRKKNKKENNALLDNAINDNNVLLGVGE